MHVEFQLPFFVFFIQLISGDTGQISQLTISDFIQLLSQSHITIILKSRFYILKKVELYQVTLSHKLCENK